MGANVFPSHEGPRYIKGMAISAAFTDFTGVLAFGLRALLVWKNGKLDRKYGSKKSGEGNESGMLGVGCEVGEEDYEPAFRYVL